MKRVFLFLPPPLTHHRSVSDGGLQRTASYCSASWRACQTCAGTGEHEMHERAHVHLCAGCSRGEFTMATGESGGGMRAPVDTGARADNAARAHTQQREVLASELHNRNGVRRCQHVSMKLALIGGGFWLGRAIGPRGAAVRPQRRRP